MTVSLIKLDPVTLWVCVDCYETHHGVSEAEERGETFDREPLSLVDSEALVTTGLTWEEHGEDCGNRWARELVDECECERLTFSRWACHGCGSHLAGEREALTIWL